MAMGVPGWHRSILLLFSLIVAVPGVGWSQETATDPGRDRVWFTVGIGLGRAAHRPPAFTWGFTGGAGLTYQPGLLLVGLQTDALWNPFHGDLLGHAALLVGAGTRSRASHISVAAGPALTSGDLQLFEADHERFSAALGLVTEVQLLGLPLSNLGAGLTAFANWNSRQSYGGVRFNLAFGQLR